MDERIIKLELPVDDVNKILFALAERPYKDVFGLVATIHEQADKQIEPTR